MHSSCYRKYYKIRYSEEEVSEEEEEFSGSKIRELAFNMPPHNYLERQLYGSFHNILPRFILTMVHQTFDLNHLNNKKIYSDC